MLQVRRAMACTSLACCLLAGFMSAVCQAQSLQSCCSQVQKLAMARKSERYTECSILPKAEINAAAVQVMIISLDFCCPSGNVYFPQFSIKASDGKPCAAYVIADHPSTH